MPSRSRNASSLRATFASLFVAPLALLIVQLPEGGMEWLGRLLSVRGGDSVGLAAALFFPYAIADAFCAAATYVLVDRIECGRRPSAPDAYGQVARRLGRLVPVACLASFVCLVGMIALILPALYFETLFFFFPQLVMSEPTLPWSVYLSRSKRLARRAFGKTLGLVLLFLALEVGVQRAMAAVESFRANGAPHSSFHSVWITTLQVFLFMVLSATIKVWASHYFIKLRAANANETASR